MHKYRRGRLRSTEWSLRLNFCNENPLLWEIPLQTSMGPGNVANIKVLQTYFSMFHNNDASQIFYFIYVYNVNLTYLLIPQNCCESKGIFIFRISPKIWKYGPKLPKTHFLNAETDKTSYAL